MSEFTPFQAAVLADDVYALTKLNSIQQAMTFLRNEHGDVFSFDEKDLLKASTGGPGIIKVKTAYGFTLLGKGVLEGHAVILFRGTQYLADWLTNLNMTISSSASGKPLHDGFNKAFKSMESELKQFMDIVNKKNVHTIHCIGHSLGGALATLCGDWINSIYNKKPYIYSFGSPRVGLHTFASSCTSNVGAKRIFRAYHKTDIVPCIPIWPFIHAPTSGRDYFLPSPGIIPMAKYHGMDQYIDSVEGNTWNVLAALRDVARDDDSVERWIKDKGLVGLTISSIDWLNHALLFVLKKCFDGAAWLISTTFATSFTLMDQLAYILNKGINLAETVSSWVLFLVQKIMRILGLNSVTKAADLSANFIRSILIHLQHKINQYTQSVLSQIMAEGRAI